MQVLYWIAIYVYGFIDIKAIRVIGVQVIWFGYFTVMLKLIQVKFSGIRYHFMVVDVFALSGGGGCGIFGKKKHHYRNIGLAFCTWQRTCKLFSVRNNFGNVTIHQNKTDQIKRWLTYVLVMTCSFMSSNIWKKKKNNTLHGSYWQKVAKWASLSHKRH